MSSTDLNSHAKSSIDFYELLGVTHECSLKEVNQAYRKTSLKYHPDKAGSDDQAAKEKFHLLGIARDLLSDPSLREIYNNARNARLQRQRQNEVFEGKRRQMKDDLEARERGVKRPRDDAEDAEEKLDRAFKKLAEEGRRKRQEMDEESRRKREEEKAKKNGTTTLYGQDENKAFGMAGRSGVSDIERTVKVRWPAQGNGMDMTANLVKTLFSKFGPIESADLLKQKKLRLTGTKKKEMTLTCMIQYTSIVGAHAAVEDFQKQTGPDWQLFRSVEWAADKEPDFLDGWVSNNATPSAPSTPAPGTKVTPLKDYTNKFNKPFGSPDIAQTNGNTLNKKPSYASFSAAAINTPKNSPFGKGLGSNSPSWEEMTMIRLRKAEQKRLAAEIQKQEEKADAAQPSQSVSA